MHALAASEDIASDRQPPNHACVSPPCSAAYRTLMPPRTLPTANQLGRRSPTRRPLYAAPGWPLLMLAEGLSMLPMALLKLLAL